MDIIVKCLAGSHLFGTNTATSDMDYKGIFIPTRKQILLGQYKESVSKSTGDDDSKNGQDDIDIEMYSVKKFFKMISKGDTAALELLFTPADCIIEKSPMWDMIVSQREKLLSSQVSAMIGYARQQANKYGIKGSRMGELATCIDNLKEIQKTFDFQNPKLKHGWEEIVDKMKNLEHVHFLELPISTGTSSSLVPAIEILGKKFDHHNSFIHVLEIICGIYKNYGARARQAKANNGIDWKALSHATRVSIQGIELLKSGKITLPLSEGDREIVMKIKTGIMPYKEVSQLLEDLLAGLERAKRDSNLPDKVDQEFLNELIINLHSEVVNAP